MDEAIYYLIMGMAVGWALSQTEPKNAPPSEAEDDPGMDRIPPDNPGLSLSEQYPDEFDQSDFEERIPEESRMELPFENNINAEHAANSGSRDADIRGQWEQDPIDGHDPDCQCLRCIHGDDAALWLKHPDEY